MKKFCLTLVLSLSAAASAMAGERVVVSCNPEYPRPDQGYSVVVKEVQRATRTDAMLIYHRAEVMALTIAGPRALGSYLVHYKPANPHMPGNSASYQGNNFKLQFHTDGAPRPDHRKLAHMEGRTLQGRDYSEKLLCKTFH